MKEIKVSEIAEHINGKLIGDGNTIIQNVAKIEEAEVGDISFVSNPKYVTYIPNTKASAIIVNENLEFLEREDICIIKVADPYFAICIIMDAFFNPANHPTKISEVSSISACARYGKDCYFGDFVSIGQNVKIGSGVKIYPNSTIGDDVVILDDTVIYSNVSIYTKSKIGSNCIIHSGVVIGSDGFGHAPLPDGSYIKIPQIGDVVIGNYVEIGANTTIDRATMGSTVIADGVKLDNLIQVAHNVKIGRNTVIASQTGISGSTELGERCIVGGQVGFVGHIKVANGTKIGAQSGIMKSIITEDLSYLGSPIKPLKDEIKSQVLIRKLPEIYSDIQELKKNN